MCLNQPQTIPGIFSLWKNYLPQNPSLVPKGLRDRCVFSSLGFLSLLKHASTP